MTTPKPTIEQVCAELDDLAAGRIRDVDRGEWEPVTGNRVYYIFFGILLAEGAIGYAVWYFCRSKGLL
jgi:hypothetical protein